MNEEHHVAWADRIGLNKQWAKCIQNCSETYGTKYFIQAVECFKSNIINIKEGPKLKDKIDRFEKEVLIKEANELLNKWLEQYPELKNSISEIEAKKREIKAYLMPRVYNYIIQLLEDEGFCFYKSNIDIDNME